MVMCKVNASSNAASFTLSSLSLIDFSLYFNMFILISSNSMTSVFDGGLIIARYKTNNSDIFHRTPHFVAFNLDFGKCRFNDNDLD